MLVVLDKLSWFEFDQRFHLGGVPTITTLMVLTERYDLLRIWVVLWILLWVVVFLWSRCHCWA